MIRFFLAAAMLIVAGEASAECVGGRCAVGVARVVTAPVRVVAPVARVVTAPVRVVAPVARAAVVAPVRVVERVVETAVPVARAVVAAPVHAVERVIENSAARHAQRVAERGFAISRRGEMLGAHSTCYPGNAEGVGFSTVSPQAAVRRCCMWGEREPIEVATAWCPSRNGWVAVVRYH